MLQAVFWGTFFAFEGAALEVQLGDGSLGQIALGAPAAEAIPAQAFVTTTRWCAVHGVADWHCSALAGAAANQLAHRRQAISGGRLDIAVVAPAHGAQIAVPGNLAIKLGWHPAAPADGPALRMCLIMQSLVAATAAGGEGTSTR